MVPTAARLTEDFRVYAPDLPGFGHSSKPSHALALPALAEVLGGWMSRMNLDRAAMVGNSFGCQVIAEFGVRHPDRLERAVLQGPTIDAHARRAIRQFGRFALDLPREKSRSISSTPTITGEPVCSVDGRPFRSPCRIGSKTSCRGWAMPVMVVRGQHDPIVSQRWVEQLTTLLPNGRLGDHAWCPHTELQRARHVCFGDSAIPGGPRRLRGYAAGRSRVRFDFRRFVNRIMAGSIRNASRLSSASLVRVDFKISTILGPSSASVNL